MVGVALVGLGDVGLGAHLPALLRHPDVEIVALVDTDSAHLERARALVPGEPLLVKDLSDVHLEAIGAVVLATPPWATPDLTVKALRNGHYVLAEKPVATSAAEASAYDTLDDDELRKVQVGLTYRHDPAIQQLRTWIHEDVLGGPLLVRAHIYDERFDPADPEHTERIRRTLTHGTPVIHEGVHVFDWLSFLLGGVPEAVDDAWAVRTEPDLPADNLIGARLTYPGGHVALVEFGWLTAALPRCEVTCVGAGGLAELDGGTFQLTLTTADRTHVIESHGDRMDRCFDLQVARFIDLVTGVVDKPSPSLADGRAALETAELVAAAATRNGAS